MQQSYTGQWIITLWLEKERKGESPKELANIWLLLLKRLSLLPLVHGTIALLFKGQLQNLPSPRSSPPPPLTRQTNDATPRTRWEKRRKVKGEGEGREGGEH